jgi:chlorobactene glucosyltransferase
VSPLLPLLLLLPPAGALLLTLLNALTWPRARPGGAVGRVSVLVPARDEAARIEACVRGALDLRPPALEVLVYDDGSTDATPDILARLQAEDPRLRVIRGGPLPEGWVGKPHAVQRLGEAALGDELLFVDADVRLEPDALQRLAGLQQALGAAVLTAVPRQDTGSRAEHLLMPLLHLTYTSFLWLPLIWWTWVRSFLAANGQVLLVRRAAWDAIGGFAAVRHEVVDDMAFCRRARALRQRVVFVDGHRLARCRMYHSGRELWEGFSKNLYEGLGERFVGLLGFLMVYGLAFVLPWVLLPVGLAADLPGLAAVGAAGVGMNLLQRLVLALRHAHRLRYLPLHPFAVLGLMGIAWNSWAWSRKGAIRWRGRSYAARGARRVA